MMAFKRTRENEILNEARTLAVSLLASDSATVLDNATGRPSDTAVAQRRYTGNVI